MSYYSMYIHRIQSKEPWSSGCLYPDLTDYSYSFINKYLYLTNYSGLFPKVCFGDFIKLAKYSKEKLPETFVVHLCFGRVLETMESWLTENLMVKGRSCPWWWNCWEMKHCCFILIGSFSNRTMLWYSGKKSKTILWQS